MDTHLSKTVRTVRPLPDADQALWDAYTRDVTPLGKPRPANHRPIVVVQFQWLSEAKLDLHGLTLVEAHTATMDFVPIGQIVSKNCNGRDWFERNDKTRVQTLVR